MWVPPEVDVTRKDANPTSHHPVMTCTVRAFMFISTLLFLLEKNSSYLELVRRYVDILDKETFSVEDKFQGRMSDRVLLGNIKFVLFNVLLKNGKKLLEARMGGEEVGSGDDDSVLETMGLVMGKVLFGLPEQFLKLDKDAVASGFEFSILHSIDQNDEDVEVPILVLIDNIMEVDAQEAKGK
ncbi:hypothetical protein S83_043769, partial [Arachis hypogaea]